MSLVTRELPDNSSGGIKQKKVHLIQIDKKKQFLTQAIQLLQKSQFFNNIKIHMLNQQLASHLLWLSQSMGVLKNERGTFVPFKLAYEPFVSKQEFYDYLGEISTIWHRVLFKLAQDRKSLIEIFTPLAQNDEMVRGFLNILNKCPTFKKDGLVLDRCDYINDEFGQPKLTQFNLFSVGMLSHMEKFQEAKRLLELDDRYIQSPTATNFAQAMKEMMDLKKEKGAVMFVVNETQTNLLDQLRFEVELRKKGIKVIRAYLKQLIEQVNVKENGDLYLGQDKIGIVYYRNLYQMQQFVTGQYDVSRAWEVQEAMETSNAISVPPIQFRLINLKRIQTELAKEDVLKRYATQEEVQKLMKTRVRQWDFDNMKANQLQALISEVQSNPKGYVLKPNREGGGNNFFDNALVCKIKELSRQQLREFILMQRIKTNVVQNLLIHGSNVYKEHCEYQISRYGSLSWHDGQIVRNQPDGFLIRAKPTAVSEGGIMVGVGAIVTWKIQ